VKATRTPASRWLRIGAQSTGLVVEPLSPLSHGQQPSFIAGPSCARPDAKILLRFSEVSEGGRMSRQSTGLSVVEVAFLLSRPEQRIRRMLQEPRELSWWRSGRSIRIDPESLLLLIDKSEGADIRRLALKLILEGRFAVPKPLSRYAQPAPITSVARPGVASIRAKERART
jgi:hypothetical protein